MTKLTVASYPFPWTEPAGLAWLYSWINEQGEISRNSDRSLPQRKIPQQLS